ERNARIIAITNSQNREPGIARVSDKLIFLNVGKEIAVPATKTFTAQLFLTAALAGCKIEQTARQVADCMQSYINSDVPEQLLNFISNKKGVTWLGRGLIQPAALDAALKLMETTNTPSAGWSTAEYLHGPVG